MLITAVTRNLFRCPYLFDIDSVNLALALRRFDPAAHQPHPPGYFLFVWLGRMLNSFIPDANAPLIAREVTFPLPHQDPESIPYLKRVADKIGARHLSIISSGHISFFTVPASALPRLFNVHP